MDKSPSYAVPILRETEDTWSRINGLTQPLSCLYDQHGNLQNCGFSLRSESSGEFYFFHSLDRKVAESVYQILSKDSSLKTLPIQELLSC
jgi:hypothetical protein